MIQDVYFDNIPSSSLGIYFLSAVIGNPEIKVIKYEIPYKDGKLDMTDYYGKVHYKNRLVYLYFIADPKKDVEVVTNEVSKLHGRRVRLEIPNRPDEYFIGRLSVSDSEVKNEIKHEITITADAEPYRYKDIMIKRVLTAESDIVCPNGEMVTYPTITTDQPVTVAYGGQTKALASGTHKLTSFLFGECDNELTITPGSNKTTVEIRYTEGRI